MELLVKKTSSAFAKPPSQEACIRETKSDNFVPFPPFSPWPHRSIDPENEFISGIKTDCHSGEQKGWPVTGLSVSFACRRESLNRSPGTSICPKKSGEKRYIQKNF